MHPFTYKIGFRLKNLFMSYNSSQPSPSRLPPNTLQNNSSQPNNLASESWAIADLLRGDFKQSQYGRIILPFCLLRRLECVLAPTKETVLAKAKEISALKLPEEALEKMLLRATNGLSFFNVSKMEVLIGL